MNFIYTLVFLQTSVLQWYIKNRFVIALIPEFNCGIPELCSTGQTISVIHTRVVLQVMFVLEHTGCVAQIEIYFNLLNDCSDICSLTPISRTATGETLIRFHT